MSSGRLLQPDVIECDIAIIGGVWAELLLLWPQQTQVGASF
jgi:hypothetical protein